MVGLRRFMAAMAVERVRAETGAGQWGWSSLLRFLFCRGTNFRDKRPSEYGPRNERNVSKPGLAAGWFESAGGAGRVQHAERKCVFNGLLDCYGGFSKPGAGLRRAAESECSSLAVCSAGPTAMAGSTR